MSSVVCRYVKSRSDKILLTVDEIYGKTNDMHYHPQSRSDDTLKRRTVANNNHFIFFENCLNSFSHSSAE